MDLWKALEQRKEQLLRMINLKKKSLQYAPKGRLRINGEQYYVRKDPKDRNGIYIPKNQKPLAEALAQKEYDQKILFSAQEELEIIEQLLQQTHMEEIYQTVNERRRKLIRSVAMEDDEFIENWLSEGYQPLGFDMDAPEYYTAKGIRVRSKSEVIIADQLDRAGIPFLYEKPLYLQSGTVRPDFSLIRAESREEIYWEHFGMMDDERYREKAFYKIQRYMADGLMPGKQLILTFESGVNPLNTRMIQKVIQTYLV